MVRPKPPCPSCAAVDSVRTLGGGTAPMYRFECGTCHHRWQQVPLHRVEIEKKHPQRKAYLCSICRLPKRGHTCVGWVPYP